eukprot:CAMPEP_0181208620 /NCGR_PEP_ID=MMETSP1096-20121128/22220_1 /TAXON_ID=156174 ORGANISM="Chrysochromulina ericina, Strain CCMP281" /NCGR_SAMPLE_ID=MMETSP1096 /ASSEMBLY_ACC=CAM_ASM_000453 /LENGTH=70 /DNA_ID=CAMNT_0023299707 /DNA_START=20 /DNA_END=232 /DNA_ORIENTATION=+
MAHATVGSSDWLGVGRRLGAWDDLLTPLPSLKVLHLLLFGACVHARFMATWELRIGEGRHEGSVPRTKGH